uniref:Putative aminotransferase YcbU n=1 Tax=Thermosporothrix sp. COM3 TaxID=2490863 RepID=A0A455SUT6_9CHLR|nr:putative aminotransferase YcbU [Thermosporothrix sp. COM3]
MTLGDSRMQYPVPPALEHPELLLYRNEFPILQRKTYFSSCSCGALSRRSSQNVTRFLDTWNEWGSQARQDLWLEEVARARNRFASIIGAQEHEVAIAPSVSVALSSIASALDYSQRKKVVLSDMEFPSLAYQWLAKRRYGVECQFVRSPDRVYVPSELFEEVVDEQTVLVATSRVYGASGYIQDIRAVADTAHRHGAYVLVDDYLGTGLIPVNVNALDVDFLVTSTQAWLMGGPGLAFVYIREGLLSSFWPTIASWFGHQEQFQYRIEELVFRSDARRIELGTPAMAAIYAANGGLDMVLEASVESICERSRYLSNDLIARARELGWKVHAPLEQERRSPIVALEVERPQDMLKELLARNIIVDCYSGLLRISPYFYNTIEENAIVIEAIAEILKNRKSTS